MIKLNMKYIENEIADLKNSVNKLQNETPNFVEIAAVKSYDSRKSVIISTISNYPIHQIN